MNTSRCDSMGAPRRLRRFPQRGMASPSDGFMPRDILDNDDRVRRDLLVENTLGGGRLTGVEVADEDGRRAVLRLAVLRVERNLYQVVRPFRAVVRHGQRQRTKPSDVWWADLRVHN